MMEKFFSRCLVTLAAGFALALCPGCRSYIDVDGKSCAMLTDREVRELVLVARETMAKNSPKHATPDEVAEIRRTEPEIKIRYYGNCLGEAVISWELETRKVEIVFDGQLNSNNPWERDIILRTMQKQPAVLDFRPGRQQPPAQRQP